MAPLRKRTPLQGGDWGEQPLLLSLSFFVYNWGGQSLCLTRGLRGCHELSSCGQSAEPRLLQSTFVTEHVCVSVKERGLGQSLEGRVGWSPMGPSPGRTGLCRFSGPVSEH